MNTPLILATADNAAAAAGGVFMFGVGLVSLVLVIAWIVFPLLMTSKIGAVLVELRRQNELLERVAKNTQPPADSNRPAPAVSHNYMREEPRSTLGGVVAIAAIVVTVVVLVVIASKR